MNFLDENAKTSVFIEFAAVRKDLKFVDHAKCEACSIAKIDSDIAEI